MKHENNPGSYLAVFIIRFKWLVLFFSIGTFLFAASGGQYITFSSNARIFFGEENPQLLALEALENTYTKDDNVLVAIAPDNQNVFTKETLSIVSELTNLFWQLPGSSRVDSLANYQHTYVDGDDLIVRDLVQDPLHLDQEEISKIKKIALNEPQLKNRMVSESGHVTGINVIFRLPDNEQLATQKTAEIVASVRSIQKEFKAKYSSVTLHITGGVMINNAFAEASQDDMQKIIPVMYLFMILVMWFTLRSASGTISSVFVIFMSSVAAMGMAGWTGIILSPPSALAPTIILTLAISDSVHILVSMLQEMKKGRTKEEAITESLRMNMQPVFLTSLTTAIGFLSMNFSDVPPFNDLGNIVAMGVAAAFLFSVTLLPAMMAILPVRVKKVISAEHPLVDKIADFVLQQRTKLLYGMTLFVLLTIAGSLKIDLNDLYLDYFDDRYAFRRDTDFIEKNLTGISLVEYSLESGEEGGISNPEYLETLEQFTTWLKKQPEVVHVNSISTIFKRLNRNMHNDREEFYRVPEKRDLAAQYLLLFEMSLPFGLDLNNMINVNKSSTRLQISLKGIYNREIRAFEKRANNWLAENAPEYMQTKGTGISMMFAFINERNVRSMILGTFSALVLISVLLIFALRSLKIGILSLIPNLVPAAMAFGLWGLTVQRIGLAVSVVAAISLGIVVDDTIHFLSKYLKARRELQMSGEEAIRYSFHTVGRAMVVTSLILIIGFGVLSLSGFKVNANMGILTSIAIAFALITDMFLLPPLLLKLHKND